jgi:hypothetical protein
VAQCHCRAKVRFEKLIRDAQNSICTAVEAVDGKPFHEDAWTREDGGGGISRVLQDGNVWEKAGVNVSVVYGSMPSSAYRAATERKMEVGSETSRVPFFAAGISSVMHPKNPHAPTMHFNYRSDPPCACLMPCVYRRRADVVAPPSQKRVHGQGDRCAPGGGSVPRGRESSDWLPVYVERLHILQAYPSKHWSVRTLCWA